MIARTTRTICELLAASALGVMVLLSIAGWRLSQGPVPLDFLTPYFVRALNGHGAPFRVTIDKTNLAWAGWDRTLDIRVVGVRALVKNDRIIAQVPEMAIGISIMALMKGVVAPTSLDIIGATVKLRRTETGALAMALGDAADSEDDDAKSEILNRLILGVQSAPNPDRPITYLKRASILNAELIIDDRMADIVWGAPQSDIVLLKEDGELRGSFFAHLNIGGEDAKLNGAASWRPNTDIIRIESEFSGVSLDRLAAKHTKLKALENVRLDLGGEAELTLTTQGVLQSASFEFNTGVGRITYTDLWPGGLPIASARLRGRYESETERLEIDRFTADLGGPVLSANATALRLGDGLTIDARVSIDKIPLPDLKQYWPRGASQKTRDWVVKNMTFGDLTDTDATLSLSMADLASGQISLDAMSGTLKLRNMTIHHLAALPPVKNVAASAVFSRDRFIAKIRHGESEGLTVRSAQVRLTKLQSDNEQADIDVSVTGPIAKALALIDRPPLRYASQFGLRPDSVEGRTETQLKFRFPVLSDLPLSKVDIQTTSRLFNPRVPNLAFGQTVSAEMLDLEVNKDRLILAGQAKIGAVDAAIKWTELFSGEEKYVHRYEAKAVLDQAKRDAIGLIDLSPYLEGPLAVDLAVLQPREGAKEIAVKLGLKDAALFVPGFEWRKPRGREGVAWLRMLIDPGGKLSVREFSVGSPGLAVDGSAEFDSYQRFTAMAIDKFELGRTNLSGSVQPAGGGAFNVEVKGASLDLSTFLDGAFEPGGADEMTAPEILPLPPLNMTVDIDRVWLNDQTPIDGLTGSVARDRSDWRDVQLAGRVGEDHEVTLAYGAGAGAQKIMVRSDNAGDALKALDVVETVQGGTMILTAEKSGRGRELPWKGSLDMADFVLVKAPVLAKVLTIASFSGINDTLAGKGIRFAKLQTPFDYIDGIATIKNARTVGAEVGLTADGTIDTRADTIKLTGTIVPAHTLNSVLGNIPVLGTILTGRRGSGIFAATYKVEGALSEPTISVNPLSALAPGLLRDLIGVLGGTIKPDKDSRPGAPDLE